MWFHLKHEKLEFLIIVLQTKQQNIPFVMFSDLMPLTNMDYQMGEVVNCLRVLDLQQSP